MFEEDKRAFYRYRNGAFCVAGDTLRACNDTFACNIIDYVTGICAAGYRKENVSSYRSFRGIAKKICMWLLIAVGAMLDILLEYAAKNVGISLGGEYIAGSLAAVWLIANEVISILENIRDIGTPLPPFLMTIAGNIKGKAEDKIK